MQLVSDRQYRLKKNSLKKTIAKTAICIDKKKIEVKLYFM